jgi:glycerol-3-phosphate dehydrogenase
VKLTKADIISSWAGYRPLISPANSKGDTSKLSRTHVVNDGPGGMITITGGKLTTYRRMGQDTVDRMAQRNGQPIQHATEEMLLDGAQGYAEANKAVDEAAPRLGWNADVVKRAKEYGGEACRILDICNEDKALAQPIVADLPYTFAEVVYACRYEMAMSLQDMMVRRLHLNFEDWSRGVAPAPAIAKVMAQELGWSEGEVAWQVEGYAKFVEGERVA